MTVLLVAVRDSLLAVSPGTRGWNVDERFSDRSRLQCVASDPQRPECIYCGTSREGLWRSDDLARSWTRVGTGILHQRITAVAVSPLEHGRSGAGVVYAGADPSALYRSEDGGETWTERRSLLALPSASTWSFPPRPATNHVRWIAPDPLVRQRIFVAIEAGALVSSTDAGRTWNDRRPDGPYDTHTLVVHPRAPGRLYSAAGDGYFESTTGGTSWVRRDDGLRHSYAFGIAVEVNDPETIVISTAGSARSAHSADVAESFLYRRMSGEPWHVVSQGLPEPAGTTISSLVADPSDAGVVFAANNRGIYRSSDMGASWEQLGLPLPDRYNSERIAGVALAAIQ